VPKQLERNQDNMPMKSSAFNIDFSSQKTDTIGSRRQAQASLKEGCPRKKCLFAAISSSSVKKLQIGTDILLIITSTSDELLSGVNIDDLNL